MSAPPGVLWSRAWSTALRLLLAQIQGDSDAADFTIGSVGSCPHCWEFLTRCSIHLAASGWTRAGDDDAVVELLCNGILSTLDRLDREDELDHEYGGSW